MSTATVASTTDTLPAGTWRSDPVHSAVDFSVRHMVVSTYRGRVPDFRATLVAGDEGSRLEATAPAAGLRFADPDQHGHVMGPDFLDADRHPELRFASTSIARRGDEVEVEGELTLRGVTRPVTLRGTIEGPQADPYGMSRLGLVLDGAFDRRDYGITWQLPLPDGGLAVGYEVRVTASVELIREA
ncbi:MAG: YceI family protein [Thermoleophilia bacterium]|nr:YceI family protein [Thermoleophilia bacterium]